MPGGNRVLIGFTLALALLERKGQAFEDFFVQAGNTLWGADFEPWKPQGQFGDFKCDGYLASEKTVFQCNAPEQFVAWKVSDKIRKDFDGARNHFGNSMQKWVFVHNQKEGLPATAGMLLTRLRDEYPNITIEPWAPNELIRRLRQLPDNELENLFPELIKELSLDDAIIDMLEDGIKEQRATTLVAAVEPQDRMNRHTLDDALDRFDDDDRDVRRRLLGYSRWYDPAKKAEIYEKLAGFGYERGLVENNAGRLHDASLIKITENHYLPLDEEICQRAAESLMDEFLRELEE